MKLPNILFILADDLGYGDVACYNPESKVPTPNIDRLANQGMLLTDAHSPSTVCTPSRYSILTGRMAFRTGFPGVFPGAGGPGLIEESRLTLPAMLQAKGYTTALFGKWHLGDNYPYRPQDRGFDEVFACGGGGDPAATHGFIPTASGELRPVRNVFSLMFRPRKGPDLFGGLVTVERDPFQ